MNDNEKKTYRYCKKQQIDLPDILLSYFSHFKYSRVIY